MGLKPCGAVLSVCTGAFYIWVLMEYMSRLRRITGRRMVAKDKNTLRLDLARGPLVVVALTVIVFALSLVVAFVKRGQSASTPGTVPPTNLAPEKIDPLGGPSQRDWPLAPGADLRLKTIYE